MDVDILLTIILYGSIAGAVILILYIYQVQQRRHAQKRAAHLRRSDPPKTAAKQNVPRATTSQPAIMQGTQNMQVVKRQDVLMPPMSPDSISDDEIDWLSLASDELKIPLNNLRALAKRLYSKGMYEPEQQKAISRRMLTTIDRMEGLLEGWNTSAQMSGIRLAVHPHAIVLVQFVEHRLQKVLASDRYTIIGDRALQIVVDPDLLGHAIDLILINSKRMHPRGYIDVVVRVQQTFTRTVTIAIADRRSANIPLADMWERMEYNLSQTIIEDQGGSIIIEPRARGGQIVTIVLPGSCIAPEYFQQQYSA